MFGALRFFLATVVIFVHVAWAGFTGIGRDGIFAFFTMSGYLMTLIMNENYGHSLRGISVYGLNRFLRIYPMYWLACLISIAILFAINADMPVLQSTDYRLPETTLLWLKNFSLVGINEAKPLLIGPAWTLRVEVFFYIAIGLGLSRTKTSTLVWLSGSFLYLFYMLISDADLNDRYFTLAAASLPFSIGAAIYHWSALLCKKLRVLTESNVAPWILLGLYMLNWPVSLWLKTTRTWGFYTGFTILVLLIIALHRRRKLQFISRKMDALLGDLSYPMYLVHSPLAWLLLYLCTVTGLPITGPSKLTFAAFILPTIFVSWLMYWLAEKRLERLRSRVKQLL